MAVFMQKIIVDGYNVIHADAALRRRLARSMEAAREWLCSNASAPYMSSRRDVQVTIVFDGAGGMVDAEALVPGRLQVLYSASGQSADDLIVDTLHAHPNPRQYIVVTSDMADIGRSVRAIGATVMSSAEFLDRLAGGGPPQAGDETRPVGEKTGAPTPRMSSTGCGNSAKPEIEMINTYHLVPVRSRLVGSARDRGTHHARHESGFNHSNIWIAGGNCQWHGPKSR